ncbi:MAG: hypothetical protein WCF18_22215, partial [Chthoniobacteraceae bacterium]
MCAALELNQTRLRPGQLVAVWGRAGKARYVWAGFARRESLGWWKQKGGELVDVPAERFAERSDRDRQLRWEALPSGLVVRGIIDPHEGQPLLKIVTRASTTEELARFEHPRMPLLEPPLIRAELI